MIVLDLSQSEQLSRGNSVSASGDAAAAAANNSSIDNGKSNVLSDILQATGITEEGDKDGASAVGVQNLAQARRSEIGHQDAQNALRDEMLDGSNQQPAVLVQSRDQSNSFHEHFHAISLLKFSAANSASYATTPTALVDGNLSAIDGIKVVFEK